VDFSKLRKEYLFKKLDKDLMEENPFEQFRLWLQEAIQNEIPEPTAMSLATCNGQRHPSCRLVLLKHIDYDGFVFFTNLESRKARELKENPYAAATFWWGELERQVRIEGKVEMVSREQVESYFAQRPRKSQLGAWASRKQSEIISSRLYLEKQLSKCEMEFKDEEVPLPPFWGGYKLIPSSIEFWQGRESRLHDRLIYVMNGNSWEIKRLSP
jgi:pyridoxamine 5'-phosphate oxidase